MKQLNIIRVALIISLIATGVAIYNNNTLLDANATLLKVNNDLIESLNIGTDTMRIVTARLKECSDKNETP